MVVRAITLGLAALTVAVPTWHATLEPKDGSKVTGTAIIAPFGYDSSQATVQISGAKAGSTVAWRITNGDCTSAGSAYGTGSAQSLKVGSNGTATGAVKLSSPPPATGNYSVTVYKSTADLTPIACGVLKSDELGQTTVPPQDTTMQPMRRDTTMPMPSDTVKPSPKDSVKP
jgi:hypothetical protein